MTLEVEPEVGEAVADRPTKIERVTAILRRRDADSIALTSAESLSWLFDGARVSVPYAGAPVLAAVMDRDGGLHVSAFANEVQRLKSEELDVAVRPVPWSGSLLPDDAGRLAEGDVLAELRAARAALLPGERSRYERLGAELATALTDVLLDARPDWSERALAAEVVRAVVAIGADPIVVLVAGADRLRHRHPLPTTAPLGSRAMLVVGARRHGLIANLSRWLGAPATARGLALLEVEADAFAATRPGRALADVLADIAASYPRHGFAADEWTQHHQGGPTGYVGRDPRATPDATDVVHRPQAFAWNPTAPAEKVEDTVVIDELGVHVLTADPRWPSLEVRGIPRPRPLPYGGY